MDNQKTTQKNKISELIESSLGSIRDLVDANTIVGTPIAAAGGTTIIPISKVTVGYAGGGNDYAGKHSAASGKNNFGGGGGTGVTMSPVGFLVVREDGRVELLNINNPTENSDLCASIETIMEKAPEIFAKIKAAFPKKKKKEAEETTEEAPETSETPAEPASDEKAE